MPKLSGQDFGLEEQLSATHGRLVSLVLEQQAKIADQTINEQLLQELVQQFVLSERELEKTNQQVVAMSRTDGLTGIANRRWFDECLEIEWARAARAKSSVGLILLDIDCFKLYNDNYGHAAGDGCLKSVAQAISGVVHRPPDLTARYGGEEIVCILPDTCIEGIEQIGNNILEAVRSLAIPHNFSLAAKIVTVSMGAALMFPSEHLLPKGLIEAADAMLYQSKKNGRNRLTVRKE
ncbi:MAG: GGDEF domain-containing protein [Alphaproteobacteria bacterium]|nr:GGDEF domain-containing protein [Alphaproteobacteria bacterium]